MIEVKKKTLEYRIIHFSSDAVKEEAIRLTEDDCIFLTNQGESTIDVLWVSHFNHCVSGTEITIATKQPFAITSEIDTNSMIERVIYTIKKSG